LFDRRKGGEKAAQPSMASSHNIGKEKIQKKSDRKVKRSTKKGVYPAEKINLK